MSYGSFPFSYDNGNSLVIKYKLLYLVIITKYGKNYNMGIIAEINMELMDQMMFKNELASRMKGNTMTRAKDLSNILSGKRDPGAQLLEEIAEGLNREWKLVEKTKVIKDYVIFDKGTPAFPGVYQVHGYLDGEPDFETLMLILIWII